MRTGPYLHPEDGMSDVWPLRILASTSSSGRSRARPLLAGFIEYTLRTISARPSSLRCSLRLHHLQDLFEPHERLALATERYDVPLEERDHTLAEDSGRGHLVHEDAFAPRLPRDPSTAEGALSELEQRATTLR